MIKYFFTLVALVLTLSQIAAQTVNEPKNTDPQWSKPYPPFRVVGNIYYVGTYDLACYLIVTEKGNILINTGLSSSAALLKGNIESLGFKFADTRILLTTQAHYDHVAAMAEIKKQTSARMMVNEKDADVLADGGSSDYALGGHGPRYQPLHADRLLKDHDTVSLGDTRIVLLHHPGHTKGSSSFLLDVKNEDTIYKVLIANMPTIVTDRKFSDISDYPDVAKDYAYTLNAMKHLSFDIWLSSHASQFDLHGKHQPSDAYNPSAFVDQKGYDKAVSELETEYQKKVAGQ